MLDRESSVTLPLPILSSQAVLIRYGAVALKRLARGEHGDLRQVATERNLDMNPLLQMHANLLYFTLVSMSNRVLHGLQSVRNLERQGFRLPAGDPVWKRLEELATRKKQEGLDAIVGPSRSRSGGFSAPQLRMS